MVEELVTATVTSCPLDLVTTEVTIWVVMGVVTLLSVREGLALGEAEGEAESDPGEAESDAGGDADGDADGDVVAELEDESVGRPGKESERDRLGREAMANGNRQRTIYR